MNARGFYMHVLVILAIISAGVSPACAFISGDTSFIQICAADGSTQTIEVDAALDPFAEPVPISTDHLETMEKCSFCFASSHHVYGEVHSFVVGAFIAPDYLAVSQGMSIPLGSDLRVYQPRGPPQLS